MPRAKKKVTLADVDEHFAAKEAAEKEPVVVEDETVAELDTALEAPVEEEKQEESFPHDAFVMDKKIQDEMVLKGLRRGQNICESVVFLNEGVQPLFALNLAVLLLRNGGTLYFPTSLRAEVASYPFMKVNSKSSPKGYKQALKKID